MVHVRYGARIGDSRRTLAEQATREDTAALAVTVGLTAELMQRNAPAEEWDAMRAVLVEQHTPEQLAGILTQAAALLVSTAAGH